MTPSALQAWLDRRGWPAYRLARTLGRHQTTVSNWLGGITAIPPELPLALCELTRQYAYREGLGTASCHWCGALAIEDDGQDNRYGCVACGARVDPDEIRRLP